MRRPRRITSLADAIGSVLWIIQRPDNRTRWEDVRGQMSALTAEATIATFLASVQGTILSLSVNSTFMSTTIVTARALAFMGMLLDVISAFLALLSSTLLQAKISEVQRLLDGIDHMSLDDLTTLQEEILASDPKDPFQKFFIDTPLWESLKFEVLKRIMVRLQKLKKLSANSVDPTLTTGVIKLSAESQSHSTSTATRARSPGDQTQNLTRDLTSVIDSDLRSITAQMERIDARVQGLMVDLRNMIPEVSAIQQSCQRIENIGSVGDAAGTAILCGGLAFLTSAVCFSVATQPVEVWIPTVVACGCVIVLPGANMLLKYFNIRLPSIFDTI